jgi:hypothetical protein
MTRMNTDEKAVSRLLSADGSQVVGASESIRGIRGRKVCRSALKIMQAAQPMRLYQR